MKKLKGRRWVMFYSIYTTVKFSDYALMVSWLDSFRGVKPSAADLTRIRVLKAKFLNL